MTGSNDDPTDEEQERIDSIVLNCGATPKLSDLELNVISDDINYICEDILFPQVMKDENRAYRLVLDNDIQLITNADAAAKTPDSQQVKDRFKAIDVDAKDKMDKSTYEDAKDKMDEFLFPEGNPVVLNKIPEFEEALDRLGENLERINDKKENLTKYTKGGMTAMLVIYIVYIVYMLGKYMYTLLDVESGGAVLAEKYNIGFATQSTYVALLWRYKDHYENFLKISYTDGDLDSGVCTAVSGIVTHIRTFYENLICYKKENTADCRNGMLTNMYGIYEDKYVKNVFMAAKSELKASVNSINKFVEKQNKFLLREENFDVNYTADNDAFEHVYRVFLHNAGANLFKDGRTAKIRRDAAKGTTYATYDEFLKNQLLQSFVNILSDPAPIYDAADPVDEKSSNLRKIVEILNALNKEYLPEYFELLDMIFHVDTKPYFNYSRSEYVEECMENISNLIYGDKHYEYFSEVKDNLKLNGTISFVGNNMIDVELTKTTLLTKVQSRKKNTLTIQKLYEEFQSTLRTSSLTPADVSEDGKFFDVYTRIKDNFNTVTEEYKVTKTIVMAYMKTYLEADGEFESDPTLRGTALANIRFLVDTMLSQLKISRDIKNNLLNRSELNLNKYISFLKFENKLAQLDDNDMDKLFKYVKQINTTMRIFRKYVKSEEMSFSKKYQKAEVYTSAVQDTKWCVLVLIIVSFGNMLEFEDRFQEMDNIVKGKTVQSFRNFATAPGSATMNFAAKARPDGAKSVASTVKKTFGQAPSATSVAKNTASFLQSKLPKGLFKGTRRGGDGEVMDDTARTRQTTDNQTQNPDTSTNTNTKAKKKTRKSKEGASKKEPERSDDSVEATMDQLTELIIPFTATIAAWIVLFTFLDGYLTKYKTDINYDKVTNITNTEIFERELDKYEVKFGEYLSSKRDTKSCKAMYLQLVKTLQAYENCNFVKGSFKTTPFPVTEMLTNGLLLTICFAVFYFTYTSTGMKDRKSNTEKLKEILEQDINEFDDDDALDDKLQGVKGAFVKDFNSVNEYWNSAYKDKEDKAEWESGEESRFRSRLIKFLNKYDNKLKKQSAENKEKGTAKDLVNSIKESDERKTLYKEIVEKYRPETEQEGFGETEGGMSRGFGFEGTVPSGQEGGENSVDSATSGVRNQRNTNSNAGRTAADTPTATAVEEVDTTVEQAMLRAYNAKKSKLEAQLISMERDTNYVNWVVAGAIISFSLYFMEKLQTNTNNYKNLMSSGGTYSRECLN